MQAKTCGEEANSPGPQSFKIWQPFPECSCDCPRDTESFCKELQSKERGLWAEAKHELKPPEDYAGHVEFDSKRCACKCNEAKMKECKSRTCTAKEEDGEICGVWEWTPEPSCTCSNTLDVKDSGHPRRKVVCKQKKECKKVCAEGFDRASCTALAEKQARADGNQAAV